MTERARTMLAPVTVQQHDVALNTLPPRSVAPLQTPAAPRFSEVGAVTATLTIASAVSLGSNMLDVKNGTMTLPQAVLNGLVKGTAATLILNATARSTALQVALAASVLAGAGYLIDSNMKKSQTGVCQKAE